MASFTIKKGYDLKLEGPPSPEVAEAPHTSSIRVYPVELGIKPRLQVKEGERVKRGSVLFVNKANDAFKFRSPAGGTVTSIVLGERRRLTEITIELDDPETPESFKKYDRAALTRLSREEVLEHLLDTGFLAYLRQRPFSRVADPEATPKSIFVNGMSTGSFQPSLKVALEGHDEAFQTGLQALTRLTEGRVHLCLPEDMRISGDIDGVDVHTFKGPHPAGNSSVHIHHIDPISPGDCVWTVRGVDLVQIGKLFLEGDIPTHRVVCVGGPSVKEEARKHYRMRCGGSLFALLQDQLEEGEQRVIGGDLLSGQQVPLDSGLRFYDASVTVIPENRERRFVGWLAPGQNLYSSARVYLSRWLKPDAAWAYHTNQNGSHRAMVLTGLYDRYMPMKIRVDHLVRAVLAHDTDEAVQLGLLETDPEDFALCAYACPSKTDIVGIIREGLEEVEEEGL